MMDELMKEVSRLVGEEYQRAAAEHGGAANTPHEGYALIKEEVEEAKEELVGVENQLGRLWNCVKSNDSKLALRRHVDRIKHQAIIGACELIQVAAMAEKTAEGIMKMEEDTR